MRGEAGALQEELIQVRAERVQLAIELHDSKEAVRLAEYERQRARDIAEEATAQATALRGELQIAEQETTTALELAERGSLEIASLREENKTIGKLQRKLLAAEEELAVLAKQRDQLTQQQQQGELLIGRLQAEMEHREEDFQVE